MENDIKLQHLLLKDNVLRSIYSETNSKDKKVDQIVTSCSLSQKQEQESIIHPLDAFCLIKKYSKNFQKIIKSQTMLGNQTNLVIESLSESTFNKAFGALGLTLKHLKSYEGFEKNILILVKNTYTSFNKISVLILFSYNINPEDLLYIKEKNLSSRNILDFEDQLKIAKQAVEYGFLGLICSDNFFLSNNYVHRYSCINH